jgi:hypothetical protein
MKQFHKLRGLLFEQSIRKLMIVKLSSLLFVLLSFIIV